MPRQPERAQRRRMLVMGGAAALLLVGCASASDASVMHLCGQIINEPAMGMQYNVPWYEDLTTRDHPATIRVPATAAFNYQTSPWLQVSHNCEHGALVSVAPTGHIKIVDSVKATDGRLAAIRIFAYRRGVATITARRDRTHTGSIEVLIH